MAARYWEKTLPTRPRPAWWRVVRCRVLGHMLTSPSYYKTITCCRCKETWP